ncbi:MAG: hypothetical protein ABEJ31_02895 [Haloarculaceae archaeon]
MPSLRDAARERKFLRHAVLTVLVFGALAVLTDHGPWTFAPAAAVLVGLEAVRVVVDAYDLPDGSALPDGVTTMALGLVIAAIAAAWLAAGPDEPWLPVLGIAFGFWVLADGFKTYRDGPVERPRGTYFDDVDGRTGEAMYRMQVAGKVGRAVRDESRTAPELAEDLGFTEAHTRDVLDSLEARGMVHRDGDLYRANEFRFQKRSIVVRLARWLPRRLARPFR